MAESDLDRAATWLSHARRIAAFTGAGISAESGIATFRDEGGLWEAFPPDEFATLDGLLRVALREPRRLAAFLRAVLEPVARAQPNAGHRALAALEAKADVAIVTQNVDGLHQEAGSSAVHEVHGSLFDVVDKRGAPLRRLSREDLLRMVEALAALEQGSFVLPRLAAAVRPLLGLGLGSWHRPSVVLFGEAMAEPAWSDALDAVHEVDILLVVGTSGLVHPAAALPEIARRRGARVVGVGPERGLADVWLEGPAGRILPALVERVG